MSRTRPALRIEALEDRLAPAAGDLDPTFGSGGVVAFPAGQFLGPFAPLPDGGVVVANGPNNTVGATLLKFNADGTRDPGFGTGGQASFPVGVVPVCVAAQPDGRIVVAARN